ncbi:hypothetical protein CPB83DRAFT_367510 [Crepidotus variabilis]|uniref:F-box domain-containing protein n=1 Tax=Crepidotus variabilis TaxID=179855 RepID=A0A9P6JPI8_9AGAR|nr:hypothetical protein CPB83DRAFT_367510 [Crepidotus variabilis]
MPPKFSPLPYSLFPPIMDHDLPRELWDCITIDLADADVWKLRGVNRILRQLALDRYFKSRAICLRVGHLSKLDHLQALSWLETPEVASRVRKLCFAAGDWRPRSYRVEGLPRSTSLKNAKTTLNAVLGLYDRFRWRHLSTTAHRLLSSFKNIDEIFVETNITTISFAIGPTEAMVELLRSLQSLSSFPNLQRLSFEFRGPDALFPAGRYQNILLDYLPPFLNSHSTTLDLLCLSVDDFLGLNFQFDLAFLSRLKRMPKLQTLRIYLPISLPSASAQLRRFLEEHAATLQHLTLQVQLPQLPIQGSVPLMSLYTPLPHLRHLDIRKLAPPDRPYGLLPNFMDTISSST